MITLVSSPKQHLPKDMQHSVCTYFKSFLALLSSVVAVSMGTPSIVLIIDDLSNKHFDRGVITFFSHAIINTPNLV